MICRLIAQDPECNFDFFNDYNDTSSWLRKFPDDPVYASTLKRLEERYAEYLKTKNTPR